MTTDPMVALYFATESSPEEGEESTGLLLAINVDVRNAHQFDVGSEVSWERALQDVAREGKNLGLYNPPVVTSRIMAQRGRFVFGPRSTDVPFSTLPLAPDRAWTRNDLMQLFAESGRWTGRLRIPPVFGIVVPGKWKAKVREVLTLTYGLNAETLFPDLPGFGAAHGIDGSPLANALAGRTLF